MVLDLVGIKISFFPDKRMDSITITCEKHNEMMEGDFFLRTTSTF